VVSRTSDTCDIILSTDRRSEASWQDLELGREEDGRRIALKVPLALLTNTSATARPSEGHDDKLKKRGGFHLVEDMNGKGD